MSRIAADPNNPIKSGKWPKKGMKAVLVALDEDDLAYINANLVNDTLRIWRKGPVGAASYLRKLAVDAIAAHKAACKHISEPLPTDVQPGWPDKSRLMAGR